ncbi:MAG TPA: RNA pyrophosphohydrolase [Methyloceanibacter sp.]|jgi:putative (di)nucleoside polyphosphate hydrolase|nr:RNA pyrophosphohydrolase [Methyloceanibacter sp.]
MTVAADLPYRPCVGVMLLNTKGEVWVGRRAPRAGRGEGGDKWWQMPQGGMNEGEDPEAAARRELEEETGVRAVSVIARARRWYTYDLPPELVGVAWEGRYRGQTQLWFAARFEGQDSEIDLGPRPGHDVEFDAWRWAPVSELPRLVVPFKRFVYGRVIEEFARVLPDAVKA